VLAALSCSGRTVFGRIRTSSHSATERRLTATSPPINACISARVRSVVMCDGVRIENMEYGTRPIACRLLCRRAILRSWTYNVATIRGSNNTPSSYSGVSFNVGSGTSCNGLTVLCGLAEETISANFLHNFNPNASSGNNLAQIGIGLNSTRAFSAASKMNNNGSNLVVDFPPALLNHPTQPTLTSIRAAAVKL
jgi:hypothetical protein